MDSWELLDIYFRDHKYPFTKHHLDSYRQFLKSIIPNTIKSDNPITMVKLDPVTGEESLKVEIYIGGKDTSGIYLDRPVVIDQDGKGVLMTPNEARLRDLTYATKLYADVDVIYTKDGSHYETKKFPYTLIAVIPLMLHSDQCMLQGQGAKVLREFNECPLDPGGYFVVDGKEKVIVSQERITTNRLFITESKEPDYSIKAYIRCTSEFSLSPRTVEFYVINNACFDTRDECYNTPVKQDFSRNQGAILVSLPSVTGVLPLAWVFRAFGIESDKAIIESICGPVENVPAAFLDFLRPSIVHGSDVMTTDAVYDRVMKRVYYESVRHLKSVLVQDVFPNIPNFEDKGKYLGYLVSQIMKTKFGLIPYSDRDSYTFKRVDISGFLLGQLFQESYTKFRKFVRDNIDQEYYYGPWKNTGQIDLLLRKDNINRILNPVIISETFLRSLKGMWGPKTDDPDQGIVQDLSRISYIGFLSHLRRVNMPLDRSIKVTEPHRLHSQQWGIMCPFESPDGASIGYLKNFALMTCITFGTNPEFLYPLFDDLGIIPLNSVPACVSGSDDTIRVFVNGTYYGITLNPRQIVATLRLYRRNALINPFVSIAWNIRENEIRIQTEAGRPCRPLIITERGKMRLPETSNVNWYNLVFGSLRKGLTADTYYHEGYVSPYALPEFQGKTEEETHTMLEKTACSIEYLDIEEENCMLIAMKREDITDLHTHTEIHPVTAFSVVTQIVPFANHNQAPRVYFHAAQSKQAQGIYATTFSKRFDTAAYIQHYPQRRLVDTRGSHYVGNNIMPNGFNVVVAVMTYSGFNQEDGVMINKTAVDRGLFSITAYKTMTAKEKALSPTESVMFANPIAMRSGGTNVEGISHANYTLLDETSGIVPKDSYIPKGQDAAVIGMVHVRNHTKTVNKGVLSQQVIEKQYRDVSIFTDTNHYGRVDKVFMSQQTPGNPNRIAKVRFRKVRRPELGDKHCLTPDHQVLTENGWMSIKDITTDTFVCALEQDNSISYTKVVNVWKYHCENESLVKFQSTNIDLVTTENHKLWVKQRDGEYGMVEAGRVDKTFTHTKAGDNTQPDFQLVKDFEVTLDMDTFLKGFGSWVSNVATNFTPDILQYLDTLSRTCLPSWVWKLSKRQAATLYDSLCISNTIHNQLAGDIQRLALHAGVYVNIEKIGMLYHIKKCDAEFVATNISNIDYIGDVYCIEVPNHIFYVRRNGKAVWTGNSSAHGQKGVVGMIIPEWDMPFTKDGIRPDIIINPHAFPSRMTIGHLVETVFSKLCCLEGMYGDGTCFIPFDKESVFDGLEHRHFERHGNEILYNGKTGRQIETEVFFGPIYYYRLKHMVADKMQARGSGPKVLLTHQPTSGRSKSGGLRIGEMERDVLLAYGMSAFAKESMMEKSDKYKWGVCRKCGIIANYAPRKGIVKCPGCTNQDIIVVETPYSLKLLIQELEAMGLQMRLFTEDMEDTADTDNENSGDEEYIVLENEKLEGDGEVADEIVATLQEQDASQLPDLLKGTVATPEQHDDDSDEDPDLVLPEGNESVATPEQDSQHADTDADTIPPVTAPDTLLSSEHEGGSKVKVIHVDFGTGKDTRRGGAEEDFEDVDFYEGE